MPLDEDHLHSVHVHIFMHHASLFARCRIDDHLHSVHVHIFMHHASLCQVPGSDALAHTQQSLVDALTVLGELRAARKQSPLVDPRESQGPGGRGAPPLVDM